jgi:hypothetical protein
MRLFRRGHGGLHQYAAKAEPARAAMMRRTVSKVKPRQGRETLTIEQIQRVAKTRPTTPYAARSGRGSIPKIQPAKTG